ncbi:alpha/beta fold hydrolase [Candidatus Spongiihabitans sp.]|uniref:alpha/beta fold hydrolase n=1 Tax=Candidatus Spongiihabitans sp. TaxID=3101308 RepID=UPI003C705228
MTEKEIALSGLTGQVIALDLGAADGVPMVALHGWRDNAASFIPLAQRLEKFRWICIDMPGHGKSAHRPAGCIYHFTDYVADIHAIVRGLAQEFDQEFNPGECNLVGHSLGAGVAAMFAAAFPDKVNRLVLIDGIGPIAGDDDDGLTQFRKSMKFLDQAPPDNVGNSYGYATWEELKSARMRTGAIDQSSVECLLRRGANWVGDRFVVHSDKRLKQHSPIYLSQKKVLALLSGIEAPTLLVMANKGQIIAKKSTAKRIAAIKNITTATVEGYHHVHMDNPELVALEIENFVAREI